MIPEEILDQLHQLMPEFEQIKTNESWLQHNEDYVRELFTDHPDHQLQPMWILVTENNHLVPVLGDFDSADTKTASINRVKQLCAILKVKRYVFISEAWMARLGKDQEICKKLQDGDMQVSQLESKVEVLILIAGDKESETTRVFEFVRDWSTSEVKELIKCEDFPDLSGRMANLLM
jgi:hypothetical protein